MALVAALFAVVTVARAAIQFDVFLGYDGFVPEASWFPVVFELKNDGPPFTGVIEVGTDNYAPGQTRRAMVELPTGTLKRVVIPVFSSSRYRTAWDARLLNEKGKTLAELRNQQARRQIAAESPVVGAMARTASGAPVLRPILPGQDNLQPATARLQSQILPDNPLVLDGLSALYLSSDRALELKDTQVRALLRWLYGGGHLIVGVEQNTDLNGNAWLRSLVPMELTDSGSVPVHPQYQSWLREPFTGRHGAGVEGSPTSKNTASPFATLPDDLGFEAAPLQVATGKLRDGEAVISTDGMPLMVTAARGRGQITLLLTSPEREPLRSWKNLPAFWAKLVDVPAAWYAKSDYNSMPALSTDGIFGAMIDSRQVRKLPIGWLLVLLVVYLLVIGPFDQMVLKRIGKPMLTWITFPCYVVLFSLLIYFIGYKLRAGETEWNELHVVDVLTVAGGSELRGQTYASLYSPLNARYALQPPTEVATVRGEFAGPYGGQDSSRTEVVQDGDKFKAEVFVPVWTSQLLVSDWWQPAAAPIQFSATPSGDGWSVNVDNRMARPLQHLRLALGGRLYDLGDLAAKSAHTFPLAGDGGVPLTEFVQKHSAGFRSAVQARQQAFGGAASGRLDDLPNGIIAASFLDKFGGTPGGYHAFVSPPGCNLSGLLGRHQAVLFAWAPDHSPVKPMNQFKPKRDQHATMFRVFAPVATQL